MVTCNTDRMIGVWVALLGARVVRDAKSRKEREAIGSGDKLEMAIDSRWQEFCLDVDGIGSGFASQGYFDKRSGARMIKKDGKVKQGRAVNEFPAIIRQTL